MRVNRLPQINNGFIFIMYKNGKRNFSFFSLPNMITIVFAIFISASGRIVNDIVSWIQKRELWIRIPDPERFDQRTHTVVPVLAVLFIPIFTAKIPKFCQWIFEYMAFYNHLNNSGQNEKWPNSKRMFKLVTFPKVNMVIR